MKIIKDNTRYYPRQETCHHCGSIIELEGRDDIHETNECGCGHMALNWLCPCCGKINTIYYDLN